MQKFKTAKKQTRFVASGRMMLRTHILKGDNSTMSNNILQFNEEIIKGQIKDLVRGNVEETLNGLLGGRNPGLQIGQNSIRAPSQSKKRKR